LRIADCGLRIADCGLRMADCQPASILVGAALVLAVVGAAAGWVPAYRASRINPADVLGIPRT
jgi:hypothetical protein